MRYRFENDKRWDCFAICSDRFDYRNLFMIAWLSRSKSTGSIASLYTLKLHSNQLRIFALRTYVVVLPIVFQFKHIVAVDEPPYPAFAYSWLNG